MVMCWHKNPKARPTFLEIIEMLLPDVSSKFHRDSFYFTQRHLMNPVDTDDAATPTTPLRSSVREDDNSESAYRYFPSATQLPEESSHQDEPSTSVAVDVSSSDFRAEASNDGSKGISVNYSDGSKGSKISSISNGSVANGHVNMNLGRATEC